MNTNPALLLHLEEMKADYTSQYLIVLASVQLATTDDQRLASAWMSRTFELILADIEVSLGLLQAAPDQVPQAPLSKELH